MAKNDTPAAKAGTNPAGAGSSLNGQNGSSKKSAASIAGLAVSSTRDGFRRAGFTWSKEPTIVALADLAKEQIAMLKSEPALTVREVDIETEAKGE